MSQDEKDEYIKIIEALPLLYAPILKEIALLAPQIQSVLDVGCGSGYLLELIHRKFPRLNLWGVDADSYFIKVARSKYPFNFSIEDGYVLTKKADLIICNLAFHHFDNSRKLINRMFDAANRAVIIADQVRPATEKDLNERIEKRKDFIHGNFQYYEEHERESILEAYSHREVEKIFQGTGLKYTLNFTDVDYYERFVATIIK